ncbi:MAG: ATP-dependent Clp protease adaptor ClpS [Prevotella sp.]|nr:ATP-dependent Clp protease adaptor ClpS [Prevotella sp.]MDD6817213.1 ATP-dependent Clp protease adaptor ClpS [Prevotellaceae bacterium]MCI6559303.1 ATP-dependent Clp protease adaptor ClpS [Prevotella sp.]MCI7045891.1 ATP-dependent Clp protease adaptor ClpS [Prevotella sp.]MDD6842685.1 ATP-dependent Clp protease adaptor ClpS [Prevotellaceae bacterium]
MPQEQSNIKERQKTIYKEPRRYKVIIHNDDFTTMDFVVKVLRDIFFMNEQDAETLMMQVHNTGQAVVGIYSYDIAQTKSQKAIKMARENGFPLRLSVKPEDE